MLRLAATALLLTVLLGAWRIAQGRDTGSRLARTVLRAHGSLGAAGVVAACVSFAYAGPWAPTTLAWEAGVMVVLALLLGVTIWRAGSSMGASRATVVLTHAALGAGGAAVLAAIAFG